jgi:predicted solute-binding protein
LKKVALPLGVICDGKVLSVYLGLKSENRNLLNMIAERQAKVSSALTKISSLGSSDIRKKASLLLNLTIQSEIPVSDLPSVKLSTASATSVMLTRILYRLWFGAESYKLACQLGKISESPVTSTAPTFELVIGDEALAKRRSYYHILDLGSLWKDFTGLPFVYATWQSYKKIPADARDIFLKAAEKAEARMKVEPQVYSPSMTPLDDTGKEIDLEDYWQRIYYRIGRKEMKALTFFLSLAKNLHPVERSDEITIKLMHMQEIANRQY